MRWLTCTGEKQRCDDGWISRAGQMTHSLLSSRLVDRCNLETSRAGMDKLIWWSRADVPLLSVKGLVREASSTSPFRQTEREKLNTSLPCSCMSDVWDKLLRTARVC